MNKNNEETNVSNDEIVERDYLSAVIEQEEALVYYEIENIYKDNKKKEYKNKLKLKKDPPVLTIKDNHDNEVFFLLTEKMTDELIDSLKEVKKAYLGFSGPSDIYKPKELKEKIEYYVKKNFLKIFLPILVIIIVLLF